MTEMPDDAQALQAIRAKLRHSTNIQFISIEEFHALIVSNSMLERTELAEAQLTKLYNIETGMSYVIESELLDTDRTW